MFCLLIYLCLRYFVHLYICVSIYVICICCVCVYVCVFFVFFFQAEDGIRDLVRSRGLGDVYKRQCMPSAKMILAGSSLITSKS